MAKKRLFFVLPLLAACGGAVVGASGTTPVAGVAPTVEGGRTIALLMSPVCLVGNDPSRCACTLPGDRACSSGSVCCGADYGGCVDVTANPQHCGACDVDCGTYSMPAYTSLGPRMGGLTLPRQVLYVASTAAFAQSGILQIRTSVGLQKVSYTGTTANTFTGCTGGSGVLAAGGTVLPGTASACTSNTDCAHCTNDGDCASMGINSRCEDIIGGSGTCGKCTDAGYCKRLTSSGHCTKGECDVCSGSGTCSCDFPSLSELQAAAPAGMSGLAFERAMGVAGSNPQECAAYASTFFGNTTTRDTPCTNGCGAGTTCVGTTCRATSLVRIAKGGSTINYTSRNFHPLGGVAVPRSGWEVLGNFVATTNDPSPGLAERGNNDNNFTDVLSATALPPTGANNPFTQPKLNNGMVGPALDYVIYRDEVASSHQAYLGNFNKLGDVVQVTNNGGTSWTAANFDFYVPSAVACGATCGSAVLCASPSHMVSCDSVSTFCASGASCIGGNCRCNATTTCNAAGNCDCVAPAACNGGICGCAGPGETCSSGVCTCVSDANCSTGQSCVIPTGNTTGRCADRVTALTVGEVQDSHLVSQRSVVVGRGANLAIIDPQMGTQSNVNLATAYVPAAGTNQATVNGILSVAINAQYGDLWVEVKGTNGYRYLLNVDPGDNSCRDGLTVQRSYQHTQTPTTPIPRDFGTTGDGHLVFMPDGMLLRYEVVVNGPPANWATYKVTK